MKANSLLHSTHVGGRQKRGGLLRKNWHRGHYKEVRDIRATCDITEGWSQCAFVVAVFWKVEQVKQMQRLSFHHFWADDWQTIDCKYCREKHREVSFAFYSHFQAFWAKLVLWLAAETQQQCHKLKTKNTQVQWCGSHLAALKALAHHHLWG